jgi:hypothetical protein
MISMSKFHAVCVAHNRVVEYKLEKVIVINIRILNSVTIMCLITMLHLWWQQIQE